MALLPLVHSPRSFMSLTRSKRFITERLPVAPPLRLRELCLDIKSRKWLEGRKLGARWNFGKDELGKNFRFPNGLISASPVEVGRDISRSVAAELENEHQVRLEFETPRFLQSLFGHEERELKYLEAKAVVNIVTRDGWLLAKGSEAGCALVQEVFKDLEEARRNGGEISPRDFRTAVDLAAAGGSGVAELSKTQLVGARGRKPVSARTPHQLEYLNLMAANEVVFGLGPAGTGKTYLAVAMALHLLKNKEVSRVILTRPAVEAGEALGFLPGDMREKVAPYLRPLYDAIDDMLGYEEGQRRLEDGSIEIAPLAYMRGRTLSRAFVILDEAQNTTREQMFMALTRLGDGSRCVVTGDISQIDLKDQKSSGLLEAEKALDQVEGVAFQHFDTTDVVRHPVVGRIIDAYTKFRTE
jgi:phosphate starvation-inducible protein PhoH and related proteins